jgi:hypothetical protein
VIGDPRYYKVCKAMFMCDTPYASTKGFDDKFESNFAKARELLKEGGYDGTPGAADALLRPADPRQPGAGGQAADGAAGMKVDMQSMDWSTLVSRRSRNGSAGQGRLERLLTSSASVDIVDPQANTTIKPDRRERLVRLADTIRSWWKNASRLLPTRPTRPSARHRRGHAGARVGKPDPHPSPPVGPATAVRKNVSGNPNAHDDLLNIEKK